MKLAGEKEAFTAQVTYDTQELYGKVEASWKIVVEPAPAPPPTAKPVRMIESGAAGIIRLLTPDPPPTAKTTEPLKSEVTKPIQVEKAKGGPK